MRVLIVGCGYVGIALGTRLVQAKHEVFGLRRNPDAAEELHASGIHPLTGDISRPEDLAKLPGPFDWVVNCVASGGGDANDYRRTYLEGTRNLLAWLASAPPKRFVYTSSTSVYGQQDGSWVTESSPTEPASATAQILIETENELLNASRRSDFPSVILRLAGIYGPDRGYWFKQFLKGEARIQGNGERYLNMIHRDDVAGCIIAALKNGRPGEIYNAVDDEPVSQLQFFQWLAEKLGKPLPPRVADAGVAKRKRGQTNKRVANQKLKMELGYRFEFPTFREGYSALADGFNSNADASSRSDERL